VVGAKGKREAALYGLRNSLERARRVVRRNLGAILPPGFRMASAIRDESLEGRRRGGRVEVRARSAPIPKKVDRTRLCRHFEFIDLT
jgi:hypothetical protein